MPRRLQQIGILAALLALAGSVPAHARAVVVTTGTPQLVLFDVPSNRVIARLTLPGPTRAVAISPDGTRAYVAAGRRVAVVDPNARAVVGDVELRSSITALALTADGSRLLAARRSAIDVIDTATLVRSSSISLKGARPGAALAVSPDGMRAAVALGRRIGLVDLAAGRLSKRRTMGAIGGIAFAPRGLHVWVSTTGTLTALNRVSARRGAKIALGRRAGGAVAISPDGRRAAVGATRGGRATAIVDLAARRLAKRVRTGGGPGCRPTRGRAAAVRRRQRRAHRVGPVDDLPQADRAAAPRSTRAPALARGAARHRRQTRHGGPGRHHGHARAGPARRPRRRRRPAWRPRERPAARRRGQRRPGRRCQQRPGRRRQRKRPAARARRSGARSPLPRPRTPEAVN